MKLVPLCPSIKVALQYAQADNFVGRAVYPENFQAQLRESAANALRAVNEDLKTHAAQLVVWDAWRPQSIQEIFWGLLPDERFVAKPLRGPNGEILAGSGHTRGVAVDVSFEVGGQLAKMPTAFDAFEPAASPLYRAADSEANENQHFLARMMAKHGFVQHAHEWWHFEFRTANAAFIDSIAA